MLYISSLLAADHVAVEDFPHEQGTNGCIPMRLVLPTPGHQTVLLLHFPELLSPLSLADCWKAPDIDVVVSSMVPRCETFRAASLQEWTQSFISTIKGW